MKKLLLLCFMLCAYLQGWADEWTDNYGITWTFTVYGSEATLTGSDFTAGDMVIPSTVYRNGAAYTVTAISDYAFVEEEQEAVVNIPAFTSVTIPSTLKKIGVMAFGESSVPKVIIPDLAAWCSMDFSNDWFTNPLNGARLFSDANTEITDLTIPEGVTRINDFAFLGCTSLTSVIIPSGVTSIGEYAFENCFNITSITIPEGVTTISEWAFSCNNNLTEVISYIKEPFAIESNVFNSCEGEGEGFTPATLYVPAGCVQAYINTQGWWEFSEIKEMGSTEPAENIWTFTTNGSNATITGCSQPEGNLVIPSQLNDDQNIYEVTAIGNMAFQNCSDITSVTIPSSVTTIGTSAFKNCSGLTKVIVPDLAAWCNINFSDFNANPLFLAHHLYSNESTEITKLVIPSGVTAINARVFLGCSALTNVSIPSSVKSIGEYAFRNCYFLKKVNIEEGLMTIGSNAFQKCSSLTSVIIPSSVTTIGSSSFSGCSVLASLTISEGVKSIGSAAFWECDRLTSVTIPEGVTSIGDDAFANCSKLTTVTMHQGVTGISSYTFTGSPLTTIKVLVTDMAAFCNNMLMSIFDGEGATSGALVEYEFIDGGEWDNNYEHPFDPYGEYYDGEGAYYFGIHPQLIDAEGNQIREFIIPEGVTSIGSYAFSGCSGLTSVTIPEGVTSIGGAAFDGCSGLTSITIPSSVTSIGSGAFSGCRGLTSVYTYMETPPSISSSTFSNRTNATLYVPYGCKAAYEVADYWKEFKEIIEMVPEENIWTFTTNGSNATITGCSQPEGDLDIPNVVTKNGNEYHVTAIGEAAFSGCTGLISVTIPEGVTNIYKTAFNGCTNLTSIIIPGSVTNIGTSAFANCSSLTNIVLSEGLRTIGENAFKQCTALKSITIPSTLETLAKYAFSYCSGLKKVIVSDLAAWCGVTFGDGNANPLNYSHHLYSDEETEITELVIPEGVTVINARAFRGCSSLKSVTIPSSVTSIGDYAFFNCSSLGTVSCDMDTPLSITANTFSNRANATLYVPAGCKSLYEDADYWKEFKEIIEMGTVSLIEQIVLGKTALNLSVGEATTLTVTITPEDATNQELVWTSSDTNVATVENGVITAIGIGTAIITVTANDGSGVSASCQVTVTEAAEEDSDYSLIDNTLYIERTEGITGQQVTLSIKMKNTVDVQGYQFDLYLPEGVTVATDEDGFSLIELSTERTTARKTDYFNATVQPDRSIRVLCGSSKGYTFEGTDGEVATITLNIGEDMEEGDYPIILKEVNLTDKNSTLYTTGYLKSTLTIINFMLGDVNGNKKVEVSDFIATANYILGNPPQVFIFKAGDLNNNNNIEVSDFIGIANIILNSSTSSNAPAAAPKKALATAPKKAATDIDALTDAIYVEPVTAAPGTQQTLSIQMKNSSPVAGFEFRLQLPEGITVATDDEGFLMAELSTERTTSRKTDYFNSSLQDDGTLQVLCGTSTADPSTGKTYVFSGNEGEVAQITVNIPEDYAEGVYEVSILDAAFSDADNNLKEVGRTVTTELTIGDNSIVLDENSTEEIAATDGPVKVVVKRTLKKDQWSTSCLPFDMTEEQVYAAFGNNVQLQEFDSYDAEYDIDDNVTGILVHFTDADLSDGFYGNYPYVIKVSEDISEFTVTAIINPLEDDCYSEYDNGRTGKNRHVYGTFYGTYHAQTTVPENGLFISDNKFWYSTGKTKMKAFRGWFEFEDVLADVEAAGANIDFTFDGTTGIREIREKSQAEGAVYTLQGQYLGKDIDLKKLPRGIYIVNGKKQVIK